MYLEYEGLLEERVGLAAAHGRLGPGDLLAGAGGQLEAHVGVGGDGAARECGGQGRGSGQGRHVAEVAALDQLYGQPARRAVVGQAQQQLGDAAVLQLQLHGLVGARRVAAGQREQVQRRRLELRECQDEGKDSEHGKEDDDADGKKKNPNCRTHRRVGAGLQVEPHVGLGLEVDGREAHDALADEALPAHAAAAVQAEAHAHAVDVLGVDAVQ